MDEAQAFGWMQRLPPEEAGSIRERWTDSMRTGDAWDSEIRLLGTDGLYHDVLSHGRPVRNEAGEIVCWVGMNLEITQPFMQDR